MCNRHLDSIHRKSYKGFHACCHLCILPKKRLMKRRPPQVTSQVTPQVTPKVASQDAATPQVTAL